MSALVYTHMESPLGRLLLTGDGHVLHGLHMEEGRRPVGVHPDWIEAEDAFEEVRTQLGGYFAGRLTSFDVPLQLEGTPFQREVWQGLLEIDYGETISYGELARRIGRPRAVRAVGLANGQNPIAVIVPCHRVIGADGTLTGYGGGLDRKRLLLDLEARLLAPAMF
jgi:methylated-DNA-[protein]-cysteine S-methyltransferase